MQSNETTTKKRKGPPPTFINAKRICALIPGDLFDRIDAIPGGRSEVIRDLLIRGLGDK